VPGDLLHVALVTSQVPHATLEAVDTSAAEDHPGVAAVITDDDVPDTRRGQAILDQPILAADKVRYVGEPIAAVAAETKEEAERAASLVDVEYERLPAVFDLEESLREDPPAVIHEDVREYEFDWFDDGRSHLEGDDAARPNLLYREREHMGDVDRGMDAADHVVEGEYEVKPFQHAAMEPHVSVVRVDQEERTTVWTSQQIPHVIERDLCKAYPDLAPTDVTIKTPFVGGGFGGKASPFLESILVALARETGPRPVRLALTRPEEYTTGVSRPAATIHVRDGVTDDGDLLAREVDLTFDSGAYNEYIFRVALFSLSGIYSAYDVPNVRYDCKQVYTNRPRTIAFRGFGKPQVYWALERHMNRVAERLGLDPLEYRTRNLLREGDTTTAGEVLGPNDTEGCLRAPVDRLASIDVEREFPAYASDEWAIGSGNAYGVKPIFRSVSTVTVRIQRDMNVVVQVGAPDIGQGSNTVLTQFAAEEFGIPPEKVTVVAGDTDRTAYDRGPTGSRFTYHAGNALQKAAADVREKLLEVAAAEFDADVSPAELSLDGDVVRARGRSESVHVDDLFTTYDHPGSVSRTTLKSRGELIGTATFDSEDAHACWTPVGQAALVAVNRLTGETDVLRFVTASDVGRAINPRNVEQQLEGATGQGIASALYEEIVYDEGSVVNPNFKDYRIPGPTELPYESETILFESQATEGPYGAKGVGEAGMIVAAPAVGNAVADALDVDPRTIPMSPERVVEMAGDLE
jgi:carbon-monoxide dehydrogenase large subunit